MKKNTIAIVAATLAVSLLAGCGSSASSAAASVASSAPASSAAQSVAEPVEQKAAYQVKNTTGKTVTELYIYEAGSEEKGENYAGEGLAADAETLVEFTAASEEEAKAIVYVLEFTMEDGTTEKFETLNFEQAQVNLLHNVDATTGATPVSFGAFEAASSEAASSEAASSEAASSEAASSKAE